MSKLVPILVTLGLAAAGAISASAVSMFKANEAYDMSKEADKTLSLTKIEQASSQATNASEHKMIMESLQRIERKVDRLSK